jgi:hypothetical protein
VIRFAAVAAFFLLSAACGKHALGEDCAQSTECADGTNCVLSGSQHIVDGGLTCVDTKKLCSITCAQDADCASLGTGHICVKDCFMGSCLQGSH